MTPLSTRSTHRRVMVSNPKHQRRTKYKNTPNTTTTTTTMTMLLLMMMMTLLLSFVVVHGDEEDQLEEEVSLDDISESTEGFGDKADDAAPGKLSDEYKDEFESWCYKTKQPPWVHLVEK